MAKGFYHYLNQMWRKPTEESIAMLRKKMINWRKEDRITKIEKPTRLDRARSLGYKAKKGIIVYRVAILRGGRTRTKPKRGRKTRRQTSRKVLKMSYQWVAEQRVQRKHRNLEVLNSYKLGKDGNFYFFEVIAVDRNAPEIRNDPQFAWLLKSRNKFRTFRGVTSAGRKSRGMSTKTRNLKVRPSIRAWNRKGK